MLHLALPCPFSPLHEEKLTSINSADSVGLDVKWTNFVEA